MEAEGHGEAAFGAVARAAAAAARFHATFHDGQTQTRAAGFAGARRVGPEERVEEFFQRRLEGVRGREYKVFDRAIDVQVSNLRRKLGDDPKNPRLVRTVRSVGYMLVDPDAER